MNLILTFVLLFSAPSAFAKTSSAEVQKRCGWMSNPSPGNLWLNDQDGTWVIWRQGDYRAKGDIKMTVRDDQFVDINFSYGFYCGCITGTFDSNTSEVKTIKSSEVKLLKDCLKDPNVPLPDLR